MRGPLGQLTAWYRRRNCSALVTSAYLLLVVLFGWIFAQLYQPEWGFSYLITFGSQWEPTRLAEIRELDYYVDRDSYGYDDQFYVQVAVDPTLRHPQLPQAVDNLSYRARRILFPAVSYALGLGRPAAILQANALLNPSCWLLLALLLLHWFPPSSWGNFVRWGGTLYTFGLCFSLRNSLVDGPALLLLAMAVYLHERGRTRGSVAVLALATLGRETSLLGATLLAPDAGARPADWRRALLRGVLVAAPFVLWLAYIRAVVGPGPGSGTGNFTLPLAAYFPKCLEVVQRLPSARWDDLSPLWSLCMLVALTVQCAFLLLRPRRESAWWRVGCSYAVLLLFLGSAVWEGAPSAASRVLLPMQVAFNVLVPAGGRWLPLLLAGNLSVFATLYTLQPPPNPGYAVHGRSVLLYGPGGTATEVAFVRGWHSGEHSGASRWRWSSGDAAIVVHNVQPFPLHLRLRCRVTSAGMRAVRVRLNGREFWSANLDGGPLHAVDVTDLELRPGDNQLEFLTDRPGVLLGSDPRPLALRLQELRIDLLR